MRVCGGYVQGGVEACVGLSLGLHSSDMSTEASRAYWNPRSWRHGFRVAGPGQLSRRVHGWHRSVHLIIVEE
jgi:hypothetical protein